MKKLLSIGILMFLLMSCATSDNCLNDITSLDKNHQEINQISVPIYLYAMMCANSDEKQESTPWVLPAYVREVKNTDIKCNFCKVRDNKQETGTGIFNMKKGGQAKVFEMRDTNNTLEQVVIAFIGTQGFYDWLFGNIGKKQRNKSLLFYDAVKKHYKEINKDNKKIKIIVTGHSLGGALALHVSSEAGVDAYIFNSSYRVKNKNPDNAKRILIEEKGDILAVQRYLWKNPCDIERYTLDCTKKDNHSIDELSGCLLKMASTTSEKAKKLCTLNCLTK